MSKSYPVGTIIRNPSNHSDAPWRKTEAGWEYQSAVYGGTWRPTNRADLARDEPNFVGVGTGWEIVEPAKSYPPGTRICWADGTEPSYRERNADGTWDFVSPDGVRSKSFLLTKDSEVEAFLADRPWLTLIEPEPLAPWEIELLEMKPEKLRYRTKSGKGKRVKVKDHIRVGDWLYFVIAVDQRNATVWATRDGTTAQSFLVDEFEFSSRPPKLRYEA